jgi:serine/threonine protein kinase
MKGSGYIASGTYGCVTGPPVRCIENASKDDASYKKSVGKLFEYVDLADEEYEKQRIIEAIDTTSDFTLPLLRKCVVNRYIPKQCEFEKLPRRVYTQLIYEKGGKDLNAYVKSYAHNEPNKRHRAFVKAFKALRPLIQGLQKLWNAGYCHLDIKPGNILFNGKRMVLIDFGLLKDVQSVFTYDSLFFLEYDYPYYPPEFKLYTIIKTGKNKCSYDKFKSTFLNSLSGYIDFTAIHDAALKAFYTRFSKEHGLTKKKLDHGIKEFTNKIDIYSLGMSLMYMYNNMKAHDMPLIADFIDRLCDLNPYTRPTAEDALAMYDSLVKKNFGIIEKKKKN